MLSAAINKTGGVPSNYAIILAGAFFFPIQLIALFFARKRRFEAYDWEKTHYEMQYRTMLSYMMISIILMGISAAAMSVLGGKSQADMTRFMAFWSILTFVGYVPMAWLAIRSIRGLFLAGAKKSLLFPKSLTVWPR
jgi:uncharacterized membrane protein